MNTIKQLFLVGGTLALSGYAAQGPVFDPDRFVILSGFGSTCVISEDPLHEQREMQQEDFSCDAYREWLSDFKDFDGHCIENDRMALVNNNTSHDDELMEQLFDYCESSKLNDKKSRQRNAKIEEEREKAHREADNRERVKRSRRLKGSAKWTRGPGKLAAQLARLEKIYAGRINGKQVYNAARTDDSGLES